MGRPSCRYKMTGHYFLLKVYEIVTVNEEMFFHLIKKISNNFKNKTLNINLILLSTNCLKNKLLLKFKTQKNISKLNCKSVQNRILF